MSDVGLFLVVCCKDAHKKKEKRAEKNNNDVVTKCHKGKKMQKVFHIALISDSDSEICFY